MGEHQLLATQAQRVPQQQLLGRDVDQVLAPDDVVDTHVGVVHGVGHEERGRPVGPADDEVLDVGVLEGDLAPDQVVPGHRAVLGHLEPDGAARARAQVPVTVGAVVGLAPGAFPLPLRHGVGPVGQPGVQEPVHGLLVDAEPGGLQHRLPVPVQAQPLECLEDHVDELLAGALHVGVLHPEQEGAAQVTGRQPVEQCGAGASQVQEPGGGRGEPDPDRLAGGGGVGGRHGGPTYRSRRSDLRRLLR